METTIAQNILRIVLGLILAAILFFGMAHKKRQESATVKFFETLVFGVVSAMPTIGTIIFILMAILNVLGLIIPENRRLAWTLVLTIPAVVIAILFGGYSL